MKYFITLLLISNLAFAVNKDLLTITNEVETDVMKLGVILDDRHDIKSFYIKSFNKGKLVKQAPYSSDISGHGAVVYKKSGRDVVRLVSNVLSNHNGGFITVKYLYNAITMKTRSKTVDLQRLGDDWQVVKDGKVLKKLHFQSNKKAIIGVIGVKDIQMY
ncbi:MAG: hypothetical protein N4A33_11815 [Bacteriovoracaceae bacterium]|jgi:calcineurin-like phosphoesterase|nr:hypothetical protein [Bacteriovoracaceae bacterium]